MEATASIFFLTTKGRRTKDGLIPVQLKVTHKLVVKGEKTKFIRKYFPIKGKLQDINVPTHVKENDIKGLTSNNPKGKYKDYKTEYNRIESLANDIIKEATKEGKAPFNFDKFQSIWEGELTNWDNFIHAAIEHTLELEKEERYNYASSFMSTIAAVKQYIERKDYKTLKDYFKKHKVHLTCRTKFEDRIPIYKSGKQLYFHDITVKWLQSFDKWLKDQGKSTSTRGIYQRNLRVLFNEGINNHDLNVDYPFKRFKPKSARRRKVALTANEISLIANYETNNSIEALYRDIFMFSFLAQGMNMADLARLRQSNIIGGNIQYVRHKTEEEEDIEETINVPITSQMQRIIDIHGVKSVGVDGHLFPFLNHGMTEKQVYYAIKDLVDDVNKQLANIGKSLGIEQKVTSYAARHSWATIAKRSGKSYEFISESLGHSNLSVTMAYMKSFDQTAQREHAEETENQIYNAG